MISHTIRLPLAALLIIFSLLISACGGGGGDSDSGSNRISYTGLTTRAAINQSNAVELSLDAYFGATFGSLADGFRQAPDSKVSEQRSVKELIRQLKRPIRTLSQQSNSINSKQITGRARYTETMQGSCGGTNRFDYDVNESTGKFTGQINYTDFCNAGITLNGLVDVEGLVDIYSAAVSQVALSFNSLSMEADTETVSMGGTIAWLFSAGGINESMNLDLVIEEQTNKHTYWYKNYLVNTSYYYDHAIQEISGQYYSHDYGYVDVGSQDTLIFYPNYLWPSSGMMVLTGDTGSSARLSFFSSSLQIEFADNDNVWQWLADMETNTDLQGVNDPPVANAGQDQEVVAGQSITLDGSASSDLDGDPLTYYWQFDSCPGYCPGLEGSYSPAVTFRPVTEGTYVVLLYVQDGETTSIADEVVVTVTALLPSNPDLLSREWKHGYFGDAIASNGLLIADINNDGSPEIITAATQIGHYDKSLWYVVNEDGNGGYHQTWSSDPTGSRLTTLKVADSDLDGISEIYVGFEDGSVRVYNGQSFSEIGYLKTTGEVLAMDVGDVDGDAIADIVISDGIKLYAYSTTDYLQKWQLTSYGGTDLVIGNVDDDSSNEIVTTSTYGHGYVIDAETQTLEWDYVAGFGYRISLGNLDTDVRQEIVGIDYSANLNIYDAEIKTPAWGLQSNHDIGGLLITDENNDGIDEIIYGDMSFGIIYCIDAQTRQEKWELGLDNIYGFSSYMGLDDLDDDGVKELVWGNGTNLIIADTSSLSLEWMNTVVYPPFAAVDTGDIDDDGEQEIVMASFQSGDGFDQGIIHVFNAQTHRLEMSRQVTYGDWMGIRSVRVGDVDDDGDTEIVVTTGDTYDGILQVYNGKDLTLEADSPAYDGLYFTTIEIADVDNDGETEIVAGQGKEHSGASGYHLIVFNGSTLAEEWKSVSLGSSWEGVTDIALGDTDNDGNIEIIATHEVNRVSVYDGVTYQLDWLGEVGSEYSGSSSVEVIDIDDDGIIELLVGADDGSIEVIDGVTYNVEKIVSTPYENEITALKATDLDGDGVTELIVSSNEMLTVYNLIDFDFDLLWQSSNLGSKLGWYNQIIVGDIDNDPEVEIVVGSGSGLYQFD